jgi:hypothetical protein
MNVTWADDQWVGWDKLDHVTYGALFWMVLGLGVSWGVYGLLFQLVLFVLGCGALEAVQYGRYQAWVQAADNAIMVDQSPPARPAQADLPSYRDLVADAVGGLLGFLLLVLLR